MSEMFCFQCEQTAKGTGCDVMGVCGKTPEEAYQQDILTCQLIALAKVVEGKNDQASIDLIVDGLFTTVTNVSFDPKRTAIISSQVEQMVRLYGGSADLLPENLFNGDEDICSLRSTLLLGLRGMAAYAHHARVLGYRDETVDQWFVTGLAACGEEHSIDEWLGLLMKTGDVNLACMKLLDEANTETYGQPSPTEVSFTVEPGPFIVISGHDLHDLKMLLEQTEGTGVKVYTHGEMLPAHGYPELRKYSQLAGNFGTAWQNQRQEFNHLPAPVLFTTNCLMPPLENYQDQLFTTSVVAYPNMAHIPTQKDGSKDFTPLIEKAIQLGGYEKPVTLTGINGGTKALTGFGRQTILDSAPEIIKNIQNGAISHIFLVGGCDGAKTGRNYYTDFVKETPDDSLILTLACGKFRFNDLDLGTINGIPRILDMGQCNDAYGAIAVAVALAEAFNCSVNELPLTLVLSWYEQKAVSILLSLLALGIKNIYIGPTLPAFFSDTVLQTLVEMFDLHPITTAKEDLALVLSK